MIAHGTDQMDPVSVAVVVISYNTRDVLRECLRSIDVADTAEIVVVDNGSVDGSTEMVRSEFPEVRLIESPNRGYGAAANTGFGVTRSEYVLLLNSDVVLSAASIRALAGHLDRHPEVAVVGPRLVNPDHTLQRSCFPFPTPLTVFLGETGTGALIHLVPVLRNRYSRTWRHDEVREIPWVLGAALAIRRAAFDEVGGFDERFFMYFEEVDLCYRLRERGWLTHFAPVTEIVHRGAASTSQQASAMRLRFYESLARFHRLHYGDESVRRLSRIVRTMWAIRMAWWAIRERIDVRSGGSRAMWTRRTLAERVATGEWAHHESGDGVDRCGSEDGAAPTGAIVNRR